MLAEEVALPFPEAACVPAPQPQRVSPIPVDDQLVAAAQEGDREAFGRLYNDFAPLVHGILLSRVPRDMVDDLMQDVFLTAMTRLGSLRDPRSFGAWIATVARNRATDYHRAPQGSALPDQLPSPRPVETEAWFILEMIQSLPEAYRDTLVLRLVEGMSGPEI